MICRDGKVRYLLQNLDWLDEGLGEYEDDYLIIDCPGELYIRALCLTTATIAPGQIELYTHHPLLPAFVTHLSRIGFRTCGVYMLESQFMEDRYKFFRSAHLSSAVTLSLMLLQVGSCLPCLPWSTLKFHGLICFPRWIL